MNVILEIIEILLSSIFGLGIPMTKSLLEFKSQIEAVLNIFPLEKAINIFIAVFSSLGIIFAIMRRILACMKTHINH